MAGRMGWCILHWKKIGEPPVRLFGGDRFTAERVFLRVKQTLKEGLLELRDATMRVKDQAGDTTVKPEKGRNCLKSLKPKE